MDLRTHLKLAAASLAIACVLWLGVHNEDRITIPLTVPVTYEHPSQIVRLQDVKEVEVRVRASRNRLATVSSADVSVIVDNGEGYLGTRLELLDGTIKTSFGIEVDSVEPARIQVEYDRLDTRSVPVEVTWTGQTADGWQVDESTRRAEPTRVQVVGPSTLLEKLERLPTLPVSVEGARDAVRVGDVQLQLPGPLLSLKEVRSVAAVVPVVPKMGSQTFTDVPVVVVPGEWETSPPNPARLTVRLEGPLPSLRRLPTGAIQLSVDVRDKPPSKVDYRVDVLKSVDQSLCPGCTIERLLPQVAVDIAVRNRKRAVAPGLDDSASPATTAQQETPAVPAVEPASPDPPPTAPSAVDDAGRTG